MAAAKDSNQAGLWDREIESPELEDAIEVLKREENLEVVSAVNKARKTVKDTVATFDLAEEERLRCGKYIIVGRRRAGGGFSVGKWEKSAVGRIETIE